MENSELDPAPVVFELFEYLLSTTSIRKSAKTKPIVFDLGPAEIWSFEPRQSGALFQRGAVKSAALRLTCSAELLLRMLIDPSFELRPVDILDVEGDIEALRPLGEHMAAAKNLVGIRIQENR